MHKYNLIYLLVLLTITVLCGNATKLPDKTLSKTELTPQDKQTERKNVVSKHLNAKTSVELPSKTKKLSTNFTTKANAGVRSTVRRLQQKKTSNSWSVPKSVIIHHTGGTRKDIIRSQMFNNPILSWLYQEKTDAIKRARNIDLRIKELLSAGNAAARDFTGMQHSRETPSFLVPERFDPRNTLSEAASIQPGATGVFNVQGGKMILGPANAGAVTGLISEVENADARSKTVKSNAQHDNPKIKPPTQSAHPKSRATSSQSAQQKSATSSQSAQQKSDTSSQSAHQKSATSSQSAQQKSATLSQSAHQMPASTSTQHQKPATTSAQQAHQKSNLYGSYEQSYVLFPDQNKIVPLPNNAPAAASIINPTFSITNGNNVAANQAAGIPACVNCAFPASSTCDNCAYPSSDAAINVPTAEYANTASTAVSGLPSASDLPPVVSGIPEAAASLMPSTAPSVDNTMINDVPTSDATSGTPTEQSTVIGTAGEAMAAPTVEQNTTAASKAADQEDDFDFDEQNDVVLGDPKKFDEKCAVMKLTFERSQGDVILDDSLKANNAQLENDAFVSDAANKSGLVMNLGEKGYLQLADNFKGKPRKAVAISMWVKLKDTQGYNPLFHATGDDEITHYDLAVQDGNGLWVHRDDAGKEIFHVESNATKSLTPDVWHHILGSYDAKKGSASLWLDGKEISTKSGVTGNLSINWDRIKMFEGKTVGTVDNVFMFRCPLDRTKIIALYVSAASPKDE